MRNRRTLARDANRNKHRDRLLGGITLFIMAVIYFGVGQVLSSTHIDPLFRAIIPSKIIELICYVFFIVLMISNSVSAIGNLYSSENMNLFLSCPISKPRLFAAKYIETLVETSIMFIIFCTPGILAYYVNLNLSPIFLLHAVLVAIPFLAIPAACAFVLGTTFVFVASVVWRRGLILFVFMLGAGVWVIRALWGILSTAEVDKNGVQSLVRMVGIFENPNAWWMPSRWASDLLTANIAAPPPNLGEKAMLLCSTALGTIAVAYLFYDAFCFRVRSRAAAHHVSGRAKSGIFSQDLVRRSLEIFYGMMPMSDQTRSIILKDLTSLVRDRAQALQLLLYCGIGTIYVIVFRFMGNAINPGQIGLQLWWAVLVSCNILFVGFILTSIMTRLVYPSVSLEGKAFWILLVAPVEIRTLVTTKFWCWLPLTSFIAVTLVLGGVLAVGLVGVPLIPITLICLAMSVGCTGIAIGLGSVFATFEWESPNQISVGLGTLALLLSSLSLVLICLVPASIVTFFSIVPRLQTFYGETVSFFLMSFSLFFILFLNVAVADFACRRGAKALAATQ